MRIGVIQASSQAAKNQMIYDAVVKFAPKESEVLDPALLASIKRKKDVMTFALIRKMK